MRRLFGLLGVAISVVLLFSSCLKGNDDDNLTSYNDMAITAFTLGTLNQYLHTTSSTGADSTYKKTLTGTSYQFHIDQIKREISNPDSLPVGTDVKHVICNISSYNGGVVVFESITKPDSLYYHSSSDSIDFSQPRKVRVYAYNSANYSTYTIRVNVHQQDGDGFSWNKMGQYSDVAQEDLNTIQARRAMVLDAGLKQYIGCSTTEFYALDNNNNLMVSVDNGQTWTKEELDNDAKLLPTENISCTYYDYSTYNDIDYVLMIGTRNTETYPQDKSMQIWHKLVDYSDTSQPAIWAYMEVADNNTRYLPIMQSPSVFRYADKFVCIGLNEGKIKVYESLDAGITWNESSIMTIPEELQTGNPVVTLLDRENYIWMEQPATGQLWRGRLNKLGWEK